MKPKISAEIDFYTLAREQRSKDIGTRKKQEESGRITLWKEKRENRSPALRQEGVVRWEENRLLSAAKKRMWS